MEEREIISVTAKANKNGTGSTFKVNLKNLREGELPFGVASILACVSANNNVSIAQLINELKEACLALSTATGNADEAAKPSEE